MHPAAPEPGKQSRQPWGAGFSLSPSALAGLQGYSQAGAAPAKQEAGDKCSPTLPHVASSQQLDFVLQLVSGTPFEEEEEVAEPLGALRAMTAILTAEPWSF